VICVGERDWRFELFVRRCELWIGINDLGLVRHVGRPTESMAYDSPLMLLSFTLMPAELMMMTRMIVNRQQAHETPEVHWAAL
jgi:hypothetical protein